MSVLDHIAFRPELSGCVGVEQEFFLMGGLSDLPLIHDPWGLGRLIGTVTPVPRSPAFLNAVNDARWTYELSACQVEYRTAPHTKVADAADELRQAHRAGEVAACQVGCALAAVEVAPWWMPLDVYPNDERYAALARTLPKRVLRAACRVAGIHVHYGCRDIHHALRVHTVLVRHLDVFKRLGDHSGGKRLELYGGMAPQHQPPVYGTVDQFERIAQEQGFAQNPRSCWHLVRISRHGTVEVRCFGNTSDLNEIFSFVSIVVAFANTVE